jgi:ketosteroid isomerase-like protein
MGRRDGRSDTASSGQVSPALRGARLEAVANEDVEAVRRFYAAWTAGDLEAMLAEVDSQVEAQPVLGLLYERPSYRGHGGISRWFEEVDDLWDHFESHVEATYDIGGAVIAFVRLVAHTRGRASDSRIAVVCRFRDGKILSFRGRDRDEVIEELHLPT